MRLLLLILAFYLMNSCVSDSGFDINANSKCSQSLKDNWIIRGFPCSRDEEKAGMWGSKELGEKFGPPWALDVQGGQIVYPTLGIKPKKFATGQFYTWKQQAEIRFVFEQLKLDTFVNMSFLKYADFYGAVESRAIDISSSWKAKTGFYPELSKSIKDIAFNLGDDFKEDRKNRCSTDAVSSGGECGKKRKLWCEAHWGKSTAIFRARQYPRSDNDKTSCQSLCNSAVIGLCKKLKAERRLNDKDDAGKRQQIYLSLNTSSACYSQNLKSVEPPGKRLRMLRTKSADSYCSILLQGKKKRSKTKKIKR